MVKGDGIGILFPATEGRLREVAKHIQQNRLLKKALHQWQSFLILILHITITPKKNWQSLHFEKELSIFTIQEMSF